MKLLIVGAAGYVGTILRPALEAAHDCTYYDRVPIPDRMDRMTVADVLDGAKVAEAVAGTEALIYMAMGATSDALVGTSGPRTDVNVVAPAFAVNVAGFFGFLEAALAVGVRRVVYASSLSVHRKEAPPFLLDDDHPADAWHPYGMSKRCAEFICQAAAQRYPDAVLVALRLMAPRTEQDFAQRKDFRDRKSPALGPEDTRRLFLAALACERPGAHVVQATGDVEEKHYLHTRAREVLNWWPEGR